MIDPTVTLDNWPWGGAGQDLDELPLAPHPWKRVVACLNVWNDVEELRRTVPRWIDHVDQVIAIDGAYEGVKADRPGSTDGTMEYLATFPKVRAVAPSRFWADQIAKRSVFFRSGGVGDLLWIVDADEYVIGAECLRSVPYLDVGWVRYSSPLYRRAQHTPRLFRWQDGLRYAGRHHWIHIGDQLAASHQAGGAGLLHRMVPLGFYNSRGALRPEQRKIAGELRRMDQVKAEDRVGPKLEAHEPLRVFQAGPFDPGGVISRLHTAINSTSPHESAMAPNGDHPFGYPKQYDLTKDRILCRDLAWGADVVHHHVTYAAWDTLQVPINHKWNVIHHHGTELRKFHKDLYAELDRQRAGLRLISNLELKQYGEGLEYLPNPVPVARYAALRPATAARSTSSTKRPFRIGHSPSKPELKGTADFLAVCEQLRRGGLRIEPVLIQGKQIRACLELKATCDLFFDSFWLGMQCSGLEAAAMGIPVIAGDPDCLREYTAWLGETPYTYANDRKGLAGAIERLVADRLFRKAEAQRVRQYVTTYHDGAAVVQRYLDLLDGAFGWREHLRLKAA